MCHIAKPMGDSQPQTRHRSLMVLLVTTVFILAIHMNQKMVRVPAYSAKHSASLET